MRDDWDFDPWDEELGEEPCWLLDACAWFALSLLMLWVAWSIWDALNTMGWLS